MDGNRYAWLIIDMEIGDGDGLVWGAVLCWKGEMLAETDSLIRQSSFDDSELPLLRAELVQYF